MTKSGTHTSHSLGPVSQTEIPVEKSTRDAFEIGRQQRRSLAVTNSYAGLEVSADRRRQIVMAFGGDNEVAILPIGLSLL
jgi:hypothetical protein